MNDLVVSGLLANGRATDLYATRSAAPPGCRLLPNMAATEAADLSKLKAASEED